LVGLLSFLLVGVGVGANQAAAAEPAEPAEPGTAEISIRATQPSPNVEELDDAGRSITVVSGTTVGQLVDQVESADEGASYTFEVVDWRGEEKIAWRDRPVQDDLATKRLDMMTTSDRLMVTDGSGVTADYEVAVPGDAPYWNDETYARIQESVAANVPDPSSYAIFDITSPAYDGLVRQVEVGGEVVDDYTRVFRQAIADSAAAGAGTVLVPARAEKYRTGAIQFENNVDLHIEDGATIDFLDIVTGEYYPRSLVSFEGIDYYGFSSPLYAYDKKNISITGGGKIEFSRTSQWSGDVNNTIRNWNYANTPIERRDAFSLNQKIPASLLQFNHSKNILIEGVTFGNSPFWSLNPNQCENLLVRDITTTSISSNSDGFNPESCRNVIVENNLFANQDDNISLKSGRTNNGPLRQRPAENMIIRGNIFWQGSGISVGSESAGGVHDIYVENNFYNSLHETDGSDPMARLGRNIFRIKTANSLDATFENIFFRNIAVGGMRENFFHIERVADRAMWSQTGQVGRYGTKKNVPHIRNLAMSNIFSVANRATGEVDSTFSGFIEAEISDLRPIDGLYFKDIDITSSRIDGAQNLAINNVTNLEMDNVRINDSRYDTDRSIRIEDVAVNGVAAKDGSTTSVTSDGDNGTLEVTGRVVTDIPDFENVGSVRASFDVDENFAPAELTRVGDEVRFTATLTDVGAGRHDLAVVAKNNTIPHYVVDDEIDNRKGADLVVHDVETFGLDVDGSLRGMDVRFEYAPALTPYSHVPVVMAGESARVVAVVTDAKTGEPVGDVTIGVEDQKVFGVETDGNVITMTGLTSDKIARGNITVSVDKSGFVSKPHQFLRVLSLPDRARLDTIMPAYGSRTTYEATGGGHLAVTADGVPFDSGTDVDAGQRVELAATPDPGFLLDGWKLNGVPIDHTGDSYSFTSLSEADVRVEFVVTFASLAAAVNDYVAGGQLETPQAERLHAQLSAAERFHRRGQPSQATQALDRFAAAADDVSDDDTRDALLAAVEALKDRL
jgi:hypothetical protein